MAGDTYPVRARFGHEDQMTREMVRGTLDSDLPGGMECLFHSFTYDGTNLHDFFAACRHHGLDHLLFDIGYGEVEAEMEARRARGAPPTGRELPLMMGEEDREYADAMLDVHARKAAEAEAGAALRVAPAAA